MPSAEVSSTSHPKESRSGRDELAHYKAQYEQLESELADFQASSRELEAELEKDIEASEKRERKLKERLDKLTYEVDEWKVCQSIGPLPGPAGGFELTTPALAADQVQAVQVRGRRRSECPTEGDHYATRHHPLSAAETARH